MSQPDRASIFHRLHRREAGSMLVLPNAWDVMSARVTEEAGASAIATSSAAVSWSLGRPDGQGLTREEMIEVVRRIAAAVRIPVTADVEGGYGRGTPDDVAETTRRVIEAGAVGINLEDGLGSGKGLLETAHQVARLAAARAAAEAEGVSLFINARVDVYYRQVGAEGERFDETVSRARAYLAAGADGIFVLGVSDPATIGRLASAIEAPLNILAQPGAPSIGELRALGVARASLGPRIAQLVMAHIRTAVTEILDRGTYETLRGFMPFPEANALFRPTGS